MCRNIKAYITHQDMYLNDVCMFKEQNRGKKVIHETYKRAVAIIIL